MKTDAEILANAHNCLAQADLLRDRHPELARTWMLVAEQWFALLKIEPITSPVGKKRRLQ